MITAMRNIFLALALSAPGLALGVLADSVADFSGVQGQGNWRFGIYKQTLPGQVPDTSVPHGYTAAAFIELDVFNGSWVASDSLVGSNNNDFLALGASQTHPNGFGPDSQNQVIWTVRRWVSPIAGTVSIDHHVAKTNVANARGRGVTGRVFVDGLEVISPMQVENANSIGIEVHIIQQVEQGTVIDFAVDPLGVGLPPTGESIFSARADGTFQAITISAVPEPAAGLLMLSGALALIGFVHWQRTRPRRPA